MVERNINKHGKNSCSKRITKSVKNLDSYGVPINMTYKQQQVFKTVPGGLLSLISKFGILLYFMLQIPEVVDKKKEVTYKTVRQNLESDNDPFNLTMDNFDIGLRVIKIGGQIPEEMIINRAKYFKFEIAMSILYQMQIGDQSITAVDNIPYELGPCESYRFGNLTKETSALGITANGWICPKLVDFSLLGTAQTLTRRSLRIRVVPCNIAEEAGMVADNITCASDEAIEEAIEQYFIQTANYKQYFDEDEFDQSPIKKEMSVQIINIQKNQSLLKANQFQKNNIKTQDSWLSSQFGNQYYQYYDIIDTSPPMYGYPKPGINDMITILFSKYDSNQEVVRQVTSLLDIFSKGGGFASFIMVFTLFLTRTFQVSLFERSLAKKIFKVQSKKKKKKSKKHVNDQESSMSQQQLTHETLWETIKSRRPLDINFLLLRFFNNFKCTICKKKRKSNTVSLQQKVNGYTQALRSEMDITTIVDNMRKIKLLIHLILSKHQRQLLPYLGSDLLSTQSFTKITESRKEVTPEGDQEIKEALRNLIVNSYKKSKDKVMLDFIINDEKRTKQPIDPSMTNTKLNKSNTNRLQNDVQPGLLNQSESSQLEELQSFRTKRKKAKQQKENLKLGPTMKEAYHSINKQGVDISSFRNSDYT